MGNHNNNKTLKRQRNQKQQHNYHIKKQNSITCCGCFNSQNRKTIQWKTNLLISCRQIEEQFIWAQKIQNMISGNDLQNALFIQDIKPLIDEQNNAKSENIENQITEEQLKKFQQSLKKSFLFKKSVKRQANRQTKINKQIQENKRADISDTYLSIFGKQTIRDRYSKQIHSESIASSIKSFVQDTLPIILNQSCAKTSKQDAESLNIFLKLNSVIQSHFLDPKFILNQIIEEFWTCTFSEYNNKQSKRSLKQFVDNIKIFLVILRNTIEDFYLLREFCQQSEYPNYFINNPDNILIIATSVLFTKQHIYKQVIMHLRKFHRQQQSIMGKVIYQMNDRLPSSFQIHDSYCLSQVSEPDFFQANKTKEPYQSSIRMLRNLSRTRTPIGKIKVIMQCTETITQSISEYYSSKRIKSTENILDADQILSIFCYIIVKSNLQDLHTHLYFIENFVTQSQIISSAGYYCSVLDAALRQLQLENKQS